MYHLLESICYLVIIPIWQSIKPIIFSPIFISSIIVFFLAPTIAIKKFSNQQRVSRIQRIYYEESLLEQLKHLDNSIKITNSNLINFENLYNLLIFNDTKTNTSNNEIILLLENISEKIQVSTKCPFSKMDILIVLFKKHGYLLRQWFFKFDSDFIKINSHIRELILKLKTKIKDEKPENNIRYIMESMKEQIENYSNLLSRHYVYISLFHQIISQISLLDFKNQESLVNNVSKNKKIQQILKNADEAFKILFGYFKLEDGVFLSYLTDEEGNRFKLHVGDEISIERAKNNHLTNSKQIYIIFNDFKLADSTCKCISQIE